MEKTCFFKVFAVLQRKKSGQKKEELNLSSSEESYEIKLLKRRYQNNLVRKKSVLFSGGFI
jgi:hypothetical protein